MLNLTNLKDHALEYRFYINRVVTAVIIVFVCFIVLSARLIYLQVVQHDRFLNLSYNNQIRTIPIDPPRGLIFDRNGILLAENSPVYSLEVIPHNVKNLNNTLNKLQTILQLNEEDLQNFKKLFKYKYSLESIPIKVRLTEEEVAKFSVNKHFFNDVEIVARLSRNYLFDQAAAHVIGFTGQISEQDLKTVDISQYRGIHQIGKSGIEKAAEDILRGKSGYKKVETDAKGHLIRELELNLPISGVDLYLTIDIDLQKKAAELLQNSQGAVVAIEPETGELLTLFSNPSFSANLFAKGMDQQSYNELQHSPSRPLFNRAISGQYSPGSIVKPLFALQALEHNIITSNFTLYDPGYYKLKNDDRLYRGWKRQGHGWIDLENAIAQSCGTYFYYVADKLGIDRMHEILTNFGFGKKVGINIEGESTGVAPSKAWKYNHKQQSWYPGETLITGLGQGYILATPLQIAQVASIIANRGKKLPIQTIKKYKLSNEQIATFEQNKEKSKNNDYAAIKITNEKNWDIIINAMEKVISSQSGTAHYIYQPDLNIAGKTGTAQVFGLKTEEKYDEHRLNKKLRDHTWFMAFAPIENPKIALAIVLENERFSYKIAGKLITFYLNKLSYNK
jgi:penicillin-binding protein 2